MSNQNPQNLSHGSSAARKLLGNHGGYRNQKAYQVAELLYDFTCRFLKFLTCWNSGLHHWQQDKARTEQRKKGAGNG
jgi:hypothetical protein